MATTKTKAWVRPTTHVPEGMSAAPISEALKALVDAAGELPTAEYAAKSAFGKDYPAGTYVSHTDERVQALVWDARNLAEKPSYRAIAEAVGIQCSAITEAVTHAVARKKKAGHEWKRDTGGRAKAIAEGRLNDDGSVAPVATKSKG